MKVSVVYALPDEQGGLSVDVDHSATVLSAIQVSNILDMFPAIDLDKQKVGIFGKSTKLDSELKEGDRVEIYRPLIWQPDDEDEDDDD